MVKIRQSVRVPPRLWRKNIKTSIKNALNELEGRTSKQKGTLLAVTKVHEVGEGKVLHGDGAVYFPTEYEALLFVPQLNEVVEGEVTEITEYGAFITVGPMTGLVHVSQISDDFFSFSKEGVLQGRESKKVLKVGDRVRARIISISHKSEPAKLGLTMRQPGLGKLEWLEEDDKDGKKG